MTDAKSRNHPTTENSARRTLPVPDPATPFAEQPADVLLAMCLFGEARGESDAARRAVAAVVLNRARFPHRVFGSRVGAEFDANLRRVILQPRQFSCFLPDDPNCAKLLRPLDHEKPEVWERCLRCAHQALAAKEGPDLLTFNSDHYFDDSLQPPPWADPPKQTVVIGRLRFYRLYLPAPPAVQPVADAPPSPSHRPRPAAPRSERSAPARGSRNTSFPALHPPRQRTPRLGPNRWLKQSRGLSSLGRANREGAFQTR